MTYQRFENSAKTPLQLLRFSEESMDQIIIIASQQITPERDWTR